MPRKAKTVTMSATRYLMQSRLQKLNSSFYNNNNNNNNNKKKKKKKKKIITEKRKESKKKKSTSSLNSITPEFQLHGMNTHTPERGKSCR